MYQQAIIEYLNKSHHSQISLKSVLFDMDGVLFNSMPYHSEAWHSAMKNRGLDLSREEAYLHEGRTGAGTINLIFRRQLGREATPEEIKEIYKEKTVEFNKHPEAERMPGALELITKIKNNQLMIMLVTGSGQDSLLNRLAINFPDTFIREHMVTAYDVKNGKPHPEPYLMALRKGNFQQNESIVIENAPLGVEAAVAAGIFTVAVNTGPIDETILVEKGANLLFPSMEALCEEWENIYQAINETRI